MKLKLLKDYLFLSALIYCYWDICQAVWKQPWKVKIKTFSVRLQNKTNRKTVHRSPASAGHGWQNSPYSCRERDCTERNYICAELSISRQVPLYPASLAVDSDNCKSAQLSLLVLKNMPSQSARSIEAAQAKRRQVPRSVCNHLPEAGETLVTEPGCLTDVRGV